MQEIPDDSQCIALKVRVGDAQGLRLMRGGEIRLVITLCTSDDSEGLDFGAKVTPWQAVPEDEAPQWGAREALFLVPTDRCFEAAFVDSAHLHVALMQRGHASPQERKAQAETPAASLKGAALGGLSAFKRGDINAARAAFSKGAASIPFGAPFADNSSAERGEMIGALKLPVGRRMACSEQDDEARWIQLLEGGKEGPHQKVKGSLLLEVSSLHVQPARPPAGADGQQQAPAPLPTQWNPENAGSSHATDKVSPRMPASSPSPGPHASSSVQGYASDSNSESGADSAASAGLGSTTSSSVAAGKPRVTGDEEAWPPYSTFSPVSESMKAVVEQAFLDPEASKKVAGIEAPVRQWTPYGCSQKMPGLSEAVDGSELNIFTINNPGTSSSSSTAQVLRDRVLKWSKKAPAAPRQFSQRLRSAFDPGARQQRREVRKWRCWHEVFCVLNEIDQRLGKALALLLQAAASMRRFGESHGSDALRTAARLPAFLCDAALYYRSEAQIPERLEEQLVELEKVADDFRNVSLEPSTDQGAAEQEEGEPAPGLRDECEDLQVDIGVLLESVIMGAHQALAEYKKMHCRLELLAKEYEPLCRLELDDASRPVSFLPLLADENAKAAASSLPEQVVHWAEDFSQLVDSSSKVLEVLARELQRRRRQLSSCLADLRALLLRRAAEGGQLSETN
eukprot:TRINITY_DN5930_c0_g2_i1.p1 TRINITY_DN5930_c0_g2~~TRINITY_DN5930_c0_g2_i1.p1  ORF type:complete len:682 (-),score=181.29 TRINITY_DN5930_c0_g2_i1:36-2081(-)